MKIKILKNQEKRTLLTKREINCTIKEAFSQKNRKFWKKEMQILAKL